MDELAKGRILRAALAAAACSVLAGCPGAGTSRPDTGCVPSKQPIDIKIHLEGNRVDGKPIKVTRKNAKGDEVSADEVKVCPGDVVRWFAPGKAFSIEFKDTRPRRVPFNWVDGKKSSTTTGSSRSVVADVVGSEVERNQPLKYDVRNDGGVMDPQIIIQD